MYKSRDLFPIIPPFPLFLILHFLYFEEEKSFSKDQLLQHAHLYISLPRNLKKVGRRKSCEGRKFLYVGRSTPQVARKEKVGEQTNRGGGTRHQGTLPCDSPRAHAHIPTIELFFCLHCLHKHTKQTENQRKNTV